MYNSVMPMHQGRDLPKFTLREIDLPTVETWEVGQEYYIVMKVKMIGKHQQQESEAPEDVNKIEGVFEMMSIKPLGEKPVDVKQLEQEDFERVRVKALTGD